jgi:EmrB/QacA subfamily drug resistance transporter
MSTVDLARPATGPTIARSRHPDLVLLVITLGYLLIALDSTVINVALPRIRTGLGFSDVGLSWVLNAYTLTFGGLLLLGGRAGDVLGRRRVLTTGIAIFTLASLAGGLAQTPAWLLTARAVQGVGAAMVTPSALALLATNFAEGPARNRALSIYSMVAGGGGSVGLVVGGLLTDLASWRWALLLNVPVGIALVLLAPRVLVQPARHPGRFDLTGAVAGTLGMLSLVLGFIEAAEHGWGSAAALSSLAAGVVLLVALVLVERRAAQPIMPLHLFADRRRAVAYVNMLLICAAMLGTFFFLTQYMQEVLGFSPLKAGLGFLPMALAMFGTVRVLPRVLPRTGPIPVLVTGATLLALGALWLSRVDTDSTYLGSVLGPFVIVGLGVGASILPSNILVLSGVAATEAGAASGLLQTAQWAGGSLGLAILVTISDAAASPAPTPAAAIAQGTAAAFTTASAVAALSLLLLLTTVARRSARTG